MNLYQIEFRHIAQKDNRNGIYCYLMAKDSEAVYEWLKEENRQTDGIDILFVSFEDYEGGDSDYKDILVNNCGETDSGYESWDDLYYGQTHVDWVLKHEGFTYDDFNTLSKFGVRIFTT